MYAFAFGSVPLGRRHTFAAMPSPARRKIRKFRAAWSVSPLNGPIRPSLVPQVLEARHRQPADVLRRAVPQRVEHLAPCSILPSSPVMTMFSSSLRK